ncbi:hypothetical protein [Lactiplantibacillus plantarum]|uniref:Uncharacterized protein n=2 Tax=Lactiplantibacillus plantarum TaxID=1590 RepID=A0AAW3RJR8_LACPN|nr:hypothetical protein [Lactiplantibacillus plantarum]AOB20781.1 hypothetical protein AVR82_14595 [Lactiplantibacillus plantarum]AOB21450.1 hypothetical protein AVR83_00190 [Lactiplantibacillus plantarum]ASZ33115.1 hypothetical protein CLC99_07495 [Lactiplantibacillus plantarum]ERO39708.1 hypothetical protein LPLWJ_31870 [Lactiplantibacillus plantarum WJL]KPN44379.1 hypothetical protein WJL_1456 [Lactiplantibacillus plantarum WJL]
MDQKRNDYLVNFKRENMVDDLFSKKSKLAGEEVVATLKKEGLTYDDAYASLQYAYNLIKYESNFLKLN